MRIKIRMASEKDLNVILTFLKDMQEEEKCYDPLLKNADEAEESLKRYIESCIKGMRSGTRFLLVAENENEGVIGIVSGRIITYGGLYHQEKILYIDNLYVPRAHRRKGIGSALLVEMEKMAQRADIKIVELDAYTASENSVSFYKKRGYRPVFIRMRKFLCDHHDK